MSLKKKMVSKVAKIAQSDSTKRIKLSDQVEIDQTMFSESSEIAVSSQTKVKGSKTNLKGVCSSNQNTNQSGIKKKGQKGTKAVPLGLPKRNLTAYAYFIKQVRIYPSNVAKCPIFIEA